MGHIENNFSFQDAYNIEYEKYWEESWQLVI